MKIADVYINIPIKSIAQAFSYIVPEKLSGIGAGWRVLVPFGSRDIEGFVVAVHQNTDIDIKKLKYIKEAVDQEAWFSPLLLEAAQWMADFYLCSAGEIMRLFMPGKSGLKIKLQFQAEADMQDHMLLMVDMYRQVYELLLSEGPLAENELKKKLAEKGYAGALENLANILESLLRYKVITRKYQSSQRAKVQTEDYAQVLQEITEDMLASLKRKKTQQKLAIFLRDNPAAGGYSLAELQKQGFSRAIVKALAETGIIKIDQRRVLRDSYDAVTAKAKEIELSDAQKQAVEKIDQQITAQENKTFLLYGVTGSGKTQVYIEAAKKARSQGKCVIVLVPEIALTGQVVQAFKGYFGHDIVVMHSRLSVNERNDAIFRVRQQEAGIIIGARSALFTPAQDVGLIIMDEEQDNSYKQDESPRYHARVVADKLAQLHGAVLLLGSATPSLETYYKAIRGEYGLLTLPKRIGNRPLPRVACVDMRRELKLGRRTVISLQLRRLIEDTLSRGEQIILMLNRRGFSTFVMCRACGEAIKCPQCTMPLVYHNDGRLLFHHCDIQQPVPDVCPKCGSTYIKYFGSGTEKLEKELREFVPQARVIRMDRDTTTGKFGHTEILDRFRKKEFDILLGTQMVAKGHDIPDVTAVGIISADSALNMPDFRAAERVFMLITQTAGRAGRGAIPGNVIVQSYRPEHNAVACGVRQDYESFFHEEMQIRKALFYPPYSRIIKLVFQHEDEAKAREMAQELKDHFLECFGLNNPLQQCIGPAPAMMARLRGISRFVVLIKTAQLEAVQSFLKSNDIDKNMQVMVDIDPITTS